MATVWRYCVISNSKCMGGGPFPFISRMIWKVSGWSGKLSDGLESFWIAWKVSWWSKKFLDSLESFQMVRKDARWSGKVSRWFGKVTAVNQKLWVGYLWKDHSKFTSGALPCIFLCLLGSHLVANICFLIVLDVPRLVYLWCFCSSPGLEPMTFEAVSNPI